MESETSSLAASALAQLGIAGLGLALIGALAFWWLRASRDLRAEKEGVIERLGSDKDRLKSELQEIHADRDKYKAAYFALRYPGSGPDPFEEG